MTQRRLRPSQGGKFMPPVGVGGHETEMDCAGFGDGFYGRSTKVRGWTSYADASTGEPLCDEPRWLPCPPIPGVLVEQAPFITPPTCVLSPVDVELERERARLVGKQVRYTDGSRHASWRRTQPVVHSVERNYGKLVALYGPSLTVDGFDRCGNLEPVPEVLP